MKNTGIHIDSDYDLDIKLRFDEHGKIVSGLVVGDVLYQNQAMLLLAHKGEIKEYPRCGAGLSDIVNDNDIQGWKSEIAEQIRSDGQRISKLELDENGLTLEANYI
jgi:hypothetical protein